MAVPGVMLAQANDEVLQNWTAPNECRVAKTAPEPPGPCRLADTRVQNGFPPPYGGRAGFHRVARSSGSADLSNVGGSRFFSPIHTEDASTESFDVLGVVPTACTLSTLVVRVSSSLDAGVTGTFTLRTGASLATMADTAITCVVTGVVPTCTGTGSVALSATDLFGLRFNYTGGSTGGDDIFLISLACQ